MNEQEKLEFAKKEIERLKEWLDFAERTWDVSIKNMEMGELKEYKEICQRNENVMNILEDYVSEKEMIIGTENDRHMTDIKKTNHILIELLEEIKSLREINNSYNSYDKGYQHGRGSCEAIVERKISILKERS